MSAKIFTQEPVSKTKKNWFDLSHDVKLSTKFGRLTPILIQETLPGDKFKIKSENLIRFAPMLAPIMHKVKAYVHYYFVPNRLLWDNWEDFITGGKDGSANPPIPRANQDINPNVGSLMDYLGFPTDAGEISKQDFNMLALAAYQKVFYDYYVDPNLDATEFRPLTNGESNDPALYNVLRNRAWAKDYFTSALPWAQRGPTVHLPLGGDAEVKINVDNVAPYTFNMDGVEPPNPTQPTYVNGGSTEAVPTDHLFADLRNITAATIQDLRRAESLQVFFEKLARGGHRYFEVLQRMFGVKNLDVRLNRAEYIGGQIQDVVISEVLQTSETGETPLADMAGHALSASMGKNSTYFAPEHGHIIGILSIMPNAAYDQGLPRHFSRSDRFDFYWKEFAHIGEQEILNKEIFYSGDSSDDDAPFGYTPRYAEYRFNNNRIAGDFRTSLRFWHMGRRFANLPNLNTDMVYTNPDAEYWTNIFNVTDEDHDYLWLHSYNHVKAQRPIPIFGTPRL